MFFFILFSFIIYSIGIKTFLHYDDNKPLQWILSCILSICLLSYLFILSLFFNITFFGFTILLIIFGIASLIILIKNPFDKLKIKINIDKWLIKFFIVILIGTILFTVKSNRWGDWDAWANWHIRAKFLCFEHSWTNLFNYKYTPDYPLLLPSIIALFWKTINNFSPIIPVIIAYLTFFSIVFVFFYSFNKPNQKIFGLIGVIILILDLGFIGQTASQYADSLLSLFILISIILINNSKDKPFNYFFIIGIFVSFTIWIKNEGIVFFTLTTTLIIYKIIKQKKFKNLCFFIAGIIPVISIYLFFKIIYAPENEILQQKIQIYSNLINFGKYLIIIKFFVLTLFKEFPLLLIFTFSILFIAPKHIFSDTLITLGLTCLIYLSFYLFTPSELNWQLNTSLNRLIHQLYPAFLYSFLVIFQNIFLNSKYNIKNQI